MRFTEFRSARNCRHIAALQRTDASGHKRTLHCSMNGKKKDRLARRSLRNLMLLSALRSYFILLCTR